VTVIADTRVHTPQRTGRSGRGARVEFWVACGWLGLMLLCALIPFWLAPYDPLAQNLTGVLASPSPEHLLGTDSVGRDVLSRLIWGSRPALIGVAIALSITLALGVLWGLVAGYVGGVVDLLLMRLADVFLAFPSVVLSIAISTILGGTLEVTMVAVGFALSPSIARLMRAGAIVVRQRDYVEASRMYGYGVWHRMVRHVAPNAILPVLVQGTIFAGVILLAQTGLGFLGIGVQPPDASWGASLGESFRFIDTNVWMSVYPGVIVVLTVLSFYAVGDRVGELLSLETPRSRAPEIVEAEKA
jgi:peptide/nickel transport system permease protein